jgi:hypothetical protein
MKKYIVAAVLFVFVVKISVDTHQSVNKHKVRHSGLTAAYKMMFHSLCSPDSVAEFGNSFSDLSSDKNERPIIRCGDLLNKCNSKPDGYYEGLDELYFADVRKLTFWVHSQCVFAYLQLLYWFDCNNFVATKNAFIRLGLKFPDNWTIDTDNSCSGLRTTFGIAFQVVLMVLIANGCILTSCYVLCRTLRTFKAILFRCLG